MSDFKMKYEIIPRYLTGPSKRRPRLLLDQCRFVVSHDTGNPGSTAASNVSYYENSRNEMEASAHIFVDDKQIIECIPFLTAPPEKAWHVVYDVTTDNQRYGADSNDAAGGIELCYGGNVDLSEAYKRYVWVMAYSCWKFGLNSATAITGHYILDPAHKTDPMDAFKLIGKTFNEFVEDVINEYNACVMEEDTMILEHDWQWQMLGDALDGLYNKGIISEYSWVEKAYSRKLTQTELAWLNMIVYARQNGVQV
ncbi:N-acetylmuramoyl-L-alanine amidase family protein [Paenibacillus sp. V4I7]|uniref:peptidoglycan recognition protein family protein n=1 Tax=Paenibacillus sp. V4I7 TaxID=3042307 RepID=UPI00278543C1|nr:peptidoglycan recognition family protein [Paenibacillus sp. V4I7]MDQ0899138.1 N-acetylmuramoyl-L-alanine amidase [Paenibacillus sp. V4I7]